MQEKKKDNIVLEDFESYVSKEKIDWTYFSDCNILITGAGGMLGSYLTETFLLSMQKGLIRGTNLYALCRNRERAEERFRDYLDDKNFHFLIQDVCQAIDLSCKIDIVLHMASPASPKNYGIDPLGTIRPNVLGTIQLLELAKRDGAKSFVYFSSAEVYGDLKTGGAVKETDFGPLDPTLLRSCYAESKRMGENLCISYFHQYQIPLKIIRPFHTYGPGMRLDDGRVFADFVSNIVKGENIEIKSDGRARRSFCYLSDAVSAYLYILSCGKSGEAYNVGNPAEEYSMKDLAEILVNLFPEKKLKVVLHPAYYEKGGKTYLKSAVDRFLPDTNKLSALGWKARIDVANGFLRTVRSFMENG